MHQYYNIRAMGIIMSMVMGWRLMATDERPNVSDTIPHPMSYSYGTVQNKKVWIFIRILLTALHISVVRRLAVGPTGQEILPGIRTRNLLITTLLT